MRATAWSNGSPSSSGAGYGLRVSVSDRDQHFDSSWDQIFIDLGARGTAIVRLSQSFWSRCTELRSAAVGRWLLERGLAPWPDGEPPRLELRRRDGNRFSLSDQPADFTA
jgi:hypothetical protein